MKIVAPPSQFNLNNSLNYQIQPWLKERPKECLFLLIWTIILSLMKMSGNNIKCGFLLIQIMSLILLWIASLFLFQRINSLNYWRLMTIIIQDQKFMDSTFLLIKTEKMRLMNVSSNNFHSGWMVKVKFNVTSANIQNV